MVRHAPITPVDGCALYASHANPLAATQNTTKLVSRLTLQWFLSAAKTNSPAAHWLAVAIRHSLVKLGNMSQHTHIVHHELVANLEVLAGRFDGAAVAGCIEGAVGGQTARLSQLQAKTGRLSASDALSGLGGSAGG